MHEYQIRCARFSRFFGFYFALETNKENFPPTLIAFSFPRAKHFGLASFSIHISLQICRGMCNAIILGDMKPDI
jgi:hypothetical protein